MLATFTVTNLNDSGPGSLRDLIQASANTTEPDTIVFESGLSGTITPASGHLIVDSEITILGPGKDTLTIDGTGTGSRLISVRDDGDLTISGMTISNANCSCSGGAIGATLAPLTVSNVDFIGNHAFNGGAVLSFMSTLEITESTFIGNSTEQDEFTRVGGAVEISHSSATISSSYFANNTADRGGAIYVNGFSSAPSIVIENTTIESNSASENGGGVEAANVASFELSHSTIVGNSAVEDGGGLRLLGSDSSSVSNSIIASNSTSQTAADLSLSGPISLQYTLLGDNDSTNFAEANPDGNGNIIGGSVGGVVDPRLAPPATNGGTIAHRTPLTGSPAIDAGDPAFVEPPGTDARGGIFNRVHNGRTDMGAIETQPRTILVDSLGGFGPGSQTLIDAIDQANNNGGPDTIVFHPTLDGRTGGLSATQETLISDSVEILGPEHNPITVSNGGPVRPLIISDSTVDEIDVTLAGLNFVDTVSAVGSNDGAFIQNTENLTIRNGEFRNGETTGLGGAIYHSDGTLLLESVRMIDNSSSQSGGAIFAASGTVTIRDSELTGNIASPSGQRAGGAIYHANGRLDISNSLLTGNSAYGDGGAIHIRGGFADIFATRIEGNQSLEAGGDGAAIYATNTNVSITGSSITENYSRDDGTLHFSGGVSELVNTTVSRNEVFDDGGALLALQNAQVDILHSTVVENVADAAATDIGAIGGLMAVSGATFNIDHSIIARNTSRLGPDDVGVAGTITASHSLIGADARNSFVSTTNTQVGSNAAPVDPELGPLVLGAGGTKFHGPLPGSPVIDGGDPLFSSTSPSTDQRSAPFNRVFGAAIDMGSIESQPQSLIVDNSIDEFDGDFSTGDLSLREALSLTGGSELDTITFAPNVQAILLTLGELNVTGSVEIIGAGQSSLMIDAQGNSRVFNVDDGDANAASQVILSGLQIVNGDTQFISGQPTVDGFGGGVLSFENLTLRDVSVSSNRADNAGGGIYSSGVGSLTVETSTISNNLLELTNGSTQGGGIFLSSSGQSSVSNSQIISNQATAIGSEGGGIFIDVGTNATVEISSTRIQSNLTDSGGGGISAEGSSGEVTIRSSSIVGNQATNSFAAGGGILNLITDGGLTLENSTLSGNSSGRFGGGIASGFDANLDVVNATISDNYAGDSGGGVFLDSVST
ncbi:MAG: choice-of-anchor Q domain-containing protein, partial [Planctomycetota bacterium]